MPKTRFALLLLGTLAVFGCNSEEPTFEVKGVVTYQPQPVTEGLVQFNDETTGRGAEVALQADGTYQAALPAGTYKVLISPPYIVDNSSGIPDPKFKPVKNIPARYRSTASSGLVAEVSAEKTTHDFALAP